MAVKNTHEGKKKTIGRNVLDDDPSASGYVLSYLERTSM
jgi:hypothetical protein